MNDRETSAVDSHSDHPDREKNTAEKWWVTIDDQPEGPHTAAYIAMLLSEQRIRPTVQVCRVGSAEWKQLNRCTELAEAVEIQTPGILPPPLPDSPSDFYSVGGFLGRFTNPRLPRLANWICVYCILVWPALTGLNFLTSLAGFNSAAALRAESPLVYFAVAYDVIGFVPEVALAIVLVFGGVLLKNLQRKGTVLLKVGLTLDLCWLVISLLLVVFWEAIVTVADAAQPISEEVTGGEIFFGLILLLMAVAMIVFEVVALVWLFRNEHHLPLQESTAVSPQMES